jgi:hypothetical protein
VVLQSCKPDPERLQREGSDAVSLMLSGSEGLDFMVATLRPARDGKVIERVKNT